MSSLSMKKVLPLGTVTPITVNLWLPMVICFSSGSIPPKRGLGYLGTDDTDVAVPIHAVEELPFIDGTSPLPGGSSHWSPPPG